MPLAASIAPEPKPAVVRAACALARLTLAAGAFHAASSALAALVTGVNVSDRLGRALSFAVILTVILFFDRVADIHVITDRPAPGGGQGTVTAHAAKGATRE